MALQRVRIAVVGDVPDLVLLTGDFGDENVELVQEISKLDMPKAMILGNHDCWNCGLSALYGERYNDKPVEQQINLIRDFDVGFNRKDFPDLKLSVVGGRPFTLGGSLRMFGKEFLEKFYGGIGDMKASAEKIKELILAAPSDHSVVVLAHNGPRGLVSQPDDICGVDFEGEEGEVGDHGDPGIKIKNNNLISEEALKFCKDQRHIPLVVFGHMHHNLAIRHGELEYRKMIARDAGTVYLNAAVVPRIVRGRTMQCEFAVVDLADGKVQRVAETWMEVSSSDREAKLVHEKVLFEKL